MIQSDSPPLEIAAPVNVQDKFGLATERESLRLVRRIPFLRRLWRNPVFQRNYARSRIKRIVENRQAFLVGIGWAALVNMLAMIERDADMRIGISLMFSLVLPLSTTFGLTYVRMFILCLTTTPIELRRNIAESELGPVFTTPMSDKQIYYGECLANFVKGLETIEALVYLAAGLLIPCAFLTVFPYLSQYSTTIDWQDVSIITSNVLLIALFLFSGLILMMLLLSLASGLYAISMPSFNAILVTLVHYAVVTGIAYAACGLFGVFTTELLPSYYDPFISEEESTVILLISQAAKTIVVIFLCQITAAMGVSAFGKSRRPGYYLPERSTSPGLED